MRNVGAQRTLRLTTEQSKALDDRSLMETAITGRDTSVSDLIRRGIDLVLSTPLPAQGGRKDDCLVVKTVGGGLCCLACGGRAGPGETAVDCPDAGSGEEVRA